MTNFSYQVSFSYINSFIFKSSFSFIEQFVHILIKFLFLYANSVMFMSSVTFMSSYVHIFIYQEGLVTRFLSTGKKSGYEQNVALWGTLGRGKSTNQHGRD